MRSAVVLSAWLLAAAAAFSASPASAEIMINIDKSTQSMTVTVDGAPRYVWPVSTGRPGYDTPNGTFKPNRMDADHLSQEWDNAPMPHTIFFDLRGHAIHGFLDTRRIGTAASHGCVRLSPENAAALYDLVGAEGMKETTVVVSGRTPAGQMPEVARRRGGAEQVAAQPLQIVPDSAQVGYDGQQPITIYGQPAYGQPAYGQPAYGQPAYQQPAYGQPLPPPSYGPPAYGQQVYQQPQQFFLIQPDGRY